ncbi:replication factor C large subunit [Candidatus Pacearchaeota archaeon]|nr:replication factor C large subunit [Candidatus Pacearchaeota archaeon]
MTTWAEKYRPIYFEDIRGQEEAVAKVIDFIKNFPSPRETPSGLKKRAIILYGSAGTGKTSLANAAAKETNSEIFELNASDLRNKPQLKETLKPAIEQRSLLKKGKILLIDEMDGIAGEDRGGIQELVELIELSEYPIIMTANDAWTKKLSPLRKKCEIIQLKDLDYKIVKDVLIKILRKEKKFIDNKILTEIALKTKGDLRAAINDAQTISKLSSEEQIKTLFDERNKEENILDVLKKIFKLKASNETLRTFDQVDMKTDEIILWVEKNIPLEYRDKKLAKAYELLSETDIFNGRIYKQQYWRFLVYENIFLSYGIASLNKENKTNFTKYKRPTRVLKIWMNNLKIAKKKTIAEKYAKHSHISIKKAMKEFPIIKLLINSNPRR